MVPLAKHGGRKRTIDVREILNEIFYVLWTGCQWQALPKDLPPKSTVWAGVALVPISISGCGLRELAAISLLGHHGIAPEKALLFSVSSALPSPSARCRRR
jgi:hypothetical protein